MRHPDVWITPETHRGLPFLGVRLVPEALLGLQLVGGSRFILLLLRSYWIRGTWPLSPTLRARSLFIQGDPANIGKG